MPRPQRSMSRYRRAAVASALAAGLGVTLGVAAPASAAPDPATPVPASNATAPDAAPLAASTPVRVTVSLSRDADALATAARDVSTPGSTSYGRFSTPTQVATRFGASAAARRSVATWLHGRGLRITHDDSFSMTAVGSASAAGAAIGTDVGAVHVTTAGRTVTRYAPRRTPAVPAALAKIVSAVHTSPETVTPLPTPLPPAPRPAKTAPATPHAGISAKQPCSQYYGQKLDTKNPPAYGGPVPYSGCWYSPQQVRKAYGFPARPTGKGVTVATVGSEPLVGGQESLQRWSKAQHVPPLRNGQLSVIGLTPPGTEPPEALDEWVGDLEAVHGLAPDADLVYVWSDGSISGDPYADDLDRIVTNRLADVVSASIGDTIYDDDLLNPVLQRAALEGITVNEASGDWGNPVDKSPRNGGYLRDTPWETLVGGTSLAIDKRGNYAWEDPWAQASTLVNADNTAWDPAPPGASEYYYEGGGGVTRVAQPWYQKGVADRNVVDGLRKRVGPDVAMEADCYVGGYGEGHYLPASATEPNGTWFTRSFCGTSMSSPMFAALEANVIQQRGGIGLGFLNPTLYGLYGSTGFHQVTDTPFGAGVTKAVVRPSTASSTPSPDKLISTGQCATQNASSKPFALITPYCGSGYNQVTGLGSPTGALFGLLASGRS